VQAPAIEGDPHRATNLSVGAAVVAFVNAILAAVVNFGIPLSTQQQSAITGVVNAFIILAIAGAHLYGQLTAEHDSLARLDTTPPAPPQ
jgi:hypothetical protein